MSRGQRKKCGTSLTNFETRITATSRVIHHRPSSSNADAACLHSQSKDRSVKSAKLNKELAYTA